VVYWWEYDNNERVPGWPLSVPRGPLPDVPRPSPEEMKRHLRNGGAIMSLRLGPMTTQMLDELRTEGYHIVTEPNEGNDLYRWRTTVHKTAAPVATTSDKKG
jgi:hypothetical protein